MAHMTARNWDALGRDQRRRYEKRGIGRRDYEAGISLTVARGHGKTPEHPERAEKNPEKYPEYVTAESKAKRRERDRKRKEKKDKLIAEVYAFKKGRWEFKINDRTRTVMWNAKRAYRAIMIDPETGKRRSLKDLETEASMVRLAIADELYDYWSVVDLDDEYESAFFYH